MLYKINVATSDIPYAGTDANVFIQLYSKHIRTEKIPLRKSNTHKNAFEQGNVDLLEIIAPDLRDIKRIK